MKHFFGEDEIKLKVRSSYPNLSHFVTKDYLDWIYRLYRYEVIYDIDIEVNFNL